jgi:membrane glycosyltransferase
MLRRAGWAVHVTAALDGSAEETPPTLLDFIRRDYRWCQGNLQHLALLGARGLHPINRAQLGMGAMAYIASPLWMITLIVGLGIQLQFPPDWGSLWYFMGPELSPFMLGTWLSGVLLVGPKIMGAVIVLSRPGELKAFGGSRTVMRGVLAEVVMSALMAPIQMVANTRSVLRVLRGRDAGWSAQQRDADGLRFADACRAMSGQIAAGLLCFGLLCAFRPDLLLAFAPIFLPLIAAPWLAIFTSKRSAGDAFAAQGLLVIPDDEGVSASPAVLGAVFRQPPRGFGRTLQDAVPSEMSKL